MNPTIVYTLFSRPISRRTFYWLLFLCPFAAWWIYFSSRSRMEHGTEKSG
jgi:hypothetical protein